MREWHFEEKIYKRWVTLMICSWEELIEDLRKSEYIYVDEMTKGAGMNIRLTFDNSKYYCTIIWMPRWSASVLVHELTHLVMATFDKTNVPIAYENEEAFAFYMEYWYAEICRVYKKYSNGRSVKEAKRDARG